MPASFEMVSSFSFKNTSKPEEKPESKQEQNFSSEPLAFPPVSEGWPNHTDVPFGNQGRNWYAPHSSARSASLEVSRPTQRGNSSSVPLAYSPEQKAGPSHSYITYPNQRVGWYTPRSSTTNVSSEKCSISRMGYYGPGPSSTALGQVTRPNAYENPSSTKIKSSGCSLAKNDLVSSSSSNKGYIHSEEGYLDS